MATPDLAPPPHIVAVRGIRVMLDVDLATLYGVTTSALNQAVNRNPARFPELYAFRLTAKEWTNLKSQSVISRSWGGRRHIPRVFTEHGAVMLAAVLNSDRAVAASLHVVDAFVRLRVVTDANRALAKKLDELADKVGEHDRAFAVVFHELRQLTMPAPEEEKPRRRIGYRPRFE